MVATLVFLVCVLKFHLAGRLEAPVLRQQGQGRHRGVDQKAEEVPGRVLYRRRSVGGASFTLLVSPDDKASLLLL